MTSSAFINLNDVRRAATKQERVDGESRHGIRWQPVVIPSDAEEFRCKSFKVTSPDPSTDARDDRVGSVAGAAQRFAVPRCALQLS
jgi:hypothetical protein